MRQTILFVDGYNMIGSWTELNKLKLADDIESARDLLIFKLSNYQKYKGIQIIIVFDAQFVIGNTTTFEQYNVHVVFTKFGETADTYIEREVSTYINPLNQVIVATSDAAEQWMIFQQGATRQSAQELLREINLTDKLIQQDVYRHFAANIRRNSPWGVNQLADLERLRRVIEDEYHTS